MKGILFSGKPLLWLAPVFLFLTTSTILGQNHDKMNQPLDTDDIKGLLSVTIPDSLKENAHAVIRKSFSRFVIDSEDKMTMSVKKVITILNSGGDQHGYFYGVYDDASKISGFKAFLYDKSGKRVGKYGKRDLEDYSLTPSADDITDNRVLTMQIDYTSYPYTVVYEYSKKYNDLFDLRDWYAIEEYNEGVMNARLVVENNSGIPLRYKPNRLSGEVQSWNDGKSQFLSVSETNLRPIVKEPYSDPLPVLVPGLNLVLARYSYDGQEGQLNSWQDIGDWINQISQGRDKLPPQAYQDILRITKDLSSKREKIKAVYEYMQERSRYVSIQLGIGGWQPFEAAFVHEKGYGDCKALSYYTKSLLRAAGIDARYTLIYAGKDPVRLDPAFPANLFNHVILSLPLEKDTVWLECTAMGQPFNYLGSFTHNRKALMVGDRSSSLVTTPEYGVEDNLKKCSGNFVIEDNGTLEGDVSTFYSGLRFDGAQSQMRKGKEEQMKDFARSLDFSGCNVQEMKIERTDKDSENPQARRNIGMRVKGYGKKSGNRVFIKPNLINRRNKRFPKVNRRVSDIVIDQPLYDVDSLVYHVPAGFSFEYIPEDLSIESDFGFYHQKITANDSVLTFVRKFKQPAGRYSPDLYQDFALFMNKIAEADDRMVVLVSKE